MSTTEPPKVAAKMSFYSEESAAAIARIPNATSAMIAAAKRVLALQPDGAQLHRVLFGHPPMPDTYPPHMPRGAWLWPNDRTSMDWADKHDERL